MAAAPPPSILNRVDPEALRRPDESEATKPAKSKGDTRKRPRRRARWKWRRVAQVFAPVLWFLLFVNTAIINLEALLIRQFPGLAPVAQYRLLAVTAALAISVTFWRSRSFYKSVLYVTLYPLVLIGWIIPRFLWAHRSWTAGIGLVHIGFGLVGGFRRGVYLWTLTVLAVVLIATDATWTPIAAASLSVFLLAWAFWLMIVQALKPDRFLEIQAKMFRWWTGNPERFEIPKELRKVHGGKFDAEASNLVADKAATATVTFYGGRFWADQIEAYTRSRAFVAFGAAAVLRYFLLFTLFIALTNLSLYESRPDEYLADGSPSLVTWLHYSLSSMMSSDVYGLAARGDLARLVATVATALGTLAIPIVAVALWQGYRYSTTSGSSDGPINTIRRECDRVEQIVQQAFFLPINEVARYLITWNNLLVGLLVSLSRFTGYDFGLPVETPDGDHAGTPPPPPGGRRHRGHKGRSRARREGR